MIVMIVIIIMFGKMTVKVIIIKLIRYDNDDGVHCIKERTGIKRCVELIDTPFAANTVQHYFTYSLFYYYELKFV